MYKNLVIKNIVAAVLLIVFAFSITPTIVLHNLVADHTDTVKKTDCSNGEQRLGKITFNCHCDHIVAESPFTDISKKIQFTTEQFFSPEPVEKTIPAKYSLLSCLLLRGPPVV